MFIFTPILLATLIAQLPPPPVIDLDTLTLGDVRQFGGKPVVAYFTADIHPYTLRVSGKVVSVSGPAEKNDGAEWSVVLKGNRLNDVNEGDRLKVRGVLWVVDHPAAVVNGVVVPRWVEVRVSEE